MDFQNSFQVDGKEILYYFFSYDKNIHALMRRRNYWKARSSELDDGSTLLRFLAKETFKQLDKNSNFPVFQHSVMIIIHYFADYRTHDLDNFIYKPIVDTIKRTLIIPDDDYSNLSIFNIGERDVQDRIEVYVIPHAFFVNFVMKNFRELTDYYTSETSCLLHN